MKQQSSSASQPDFDVPRALASVCGGAPRHTQLRACSSQLQTTSSYGVVVLLQLAPSATWRASTRSGGAVPACFTRKARPARNTPTRESEVTVHEVFEELLLARALARI